MKTTAPTHDAISQRARQIWESEGNPQGRDTAIWLNAEQQLSAPPTLPAKTAPQLAAAAEVRGSGTTQSTTTPATNPSPAAAAAQVQQQKKAARSPHVAVPHPAHTPTPPQSGKPIWDKPHSS
jgi:hypothetical protein